MDKIILESDFEKILAAKKNAGERGAALAIAVIMVVILAVVGLTALAFSSSEVRIAGSDLQRTQTFYATSAAIEKMTSDFGNLFLTKLNPTRKDLDDIEDAPPQPLKDEGFSFDQTLEEDTSRLTELRAIQGLSNTVYPRVNISDGPYAGLYASVIPYKISSTGTMDSTGTQVKLEREFNNYLVPLFQFGMFSNDDIEIHPGPLLTFNGRVHSNKNIYALQNTQFLNRLTMAGEFVRDAWRNGKANDGAGKNNVYVRVNGTDVQSTIGNGSVKADSANIGGPNIPGATAKDRGYYPESPNGVPNPNWETESVKSPAAGATDSFGSQVLTRTTGVKKVKLPLETGGSSAAELIKRALPSDSAVLAASRYHNKSQIRILIDDVAAGSGTTNVAGIPAGKGVVFSNNSAGFSPLPLGNGNVLRRVDDSGSYVSTDTLVVQKKAGTSTETAMTVRGIKNSAETVNGNYIPGGSGITGRVLIEVVKPDGSALDVTDKILSMGMTEGEPNGIVYLQRPMWAAFVQGSRDRTDATTSAFNLVNLTRNFQSIADGEVTPPTPAMFYANRGFLDTSESVARDDIGSLTREAVPSGYNEIVPINVYNVREGWVRSTMEQRNIYYERGITSVVELNMRNLARWVDGKYDANLLAGTNAVSTNIKGDEGYVVYVSDRRGDCVKAEYLSTGASYASTNGSVDNEDIYGPNGVLDPGEDVIDFGWDTTQGGASKKGTLQNDTSELPNTGLNYSSVALGAVVADRITRAQDAMRYQTSFFRRAVRLFGGDTMSFGAAAGKLSPTKGISVSSENMIYIWGNYNATGITGIPATGSTLNNGGFTGAQIPASIVCDAIFPLSKTWFDASSALYPEGISGADVYRKADESLPSTSESTTVRAAILAGTNISAITGDPGRNAANDRINGGIHNYPRFLEIWGDDFPWNYTGSLVPLFYSTQAVSQYEDSGASIYSPPRRNWSFDDTFLTPQNLPPGTPFFQYVQATGFRQSLR
jgi:hypothetical protein